jgi:hypothetical protein
MLIYSFARICLVLLLARMSLLLRYFLSLHLNTTFHIGSRKTAVTFFWCPLNLLLFLWASESFIFDQDAKHQTKTLSHGNISDYSVLAVRYGNDNGIMPT